MTRHAERQAEYRAARDAYLREHAWCEVCNTAPATQVHHKRGRLGRLLTDAEHFLAVCPYCHDEITRRPAWALERGYSERRLSEAP